MEAPAAPSLAARLLMALVRLYQVTLSWLLGGHCRFTPSCSHYAMECLRNVGAWRGTILTLQRLSRCHPFHTGGYDPPPPPPPSRDDGHTHCTPTLGRTDAV